MINLTNNSEPNSALNQIVSVIRSFGNWLSSAVDVGGRMRVNVETGTVGIAAGQTLGTVTTVGTVSTITAGTITTVQTVTNQAQMGTFSTQDQIPALMAMNAYGLRSGISVT